MGGRKACERERRVKQKEADLVASKRKVAIFEKRHFDVKKDQKILLEEFAKEYLKLHSRVNKKPKGVITDEGTIKNLLKTFAGKYLYEITPMMIEAYKSERLKTVSPATVNRELACFKNMFNKAILWKKASDNPVRQVKLLKENNRRLRYLEQNEITKLVDNCSAHLKPIVIVAVFTGMRKREILDLRWDDIDFTRGIIYLLDTKNSEKREVLMNEIVSKTLAVLERTPDNPYVFASRTGKPYTEIRKSFSTALARCGINNFHFHDLRHSYASQLVMMGVDIMTVKELMGHKSIEMTMRYAHLSVDHKRKAVELLGEKVGALWAQLPLEAPKPESHDTGNSMQII